MPALLNQLNEDLEEVVERARKSLVRVASGEGANGAGSIWHPDGLIVTNAHVVQRPPIRVMLADGRALPAEVLAIDHERDVAALSVAANGLPTCELGESRKLRAGEWVVALGHPWGVDRCQYRGCGYRGRPRAIRQHSTKSRLDSCQCSVETGKLGRSSGRFWWPVGRHQYGNGWPAGWLCRARS